MQAWVNIFIPEVIFWNIWGLTAPFIFFLSRKFSYEVQPLSWRWLVHIPLGILTITGIYILYIGLFGVYHQLCTLIGLPISGSFGQAIQSRAVAILGIGVPLGSMIYGLLVAIPQIKNYYERMRTEESRSQALKTQLAEAELQALKMQLQPHFLFNSLNTISATLQTDPQAADRMIAQLGDFLRLTLDHADRAIVPLSDELAFNRKYLDIEKNRFEERLHVIIAASPEVEAAAVPYLLLQPLVENAIQHGVSQQIGRGQVSIKAWKDNGSLLLDVSNSGPPIKESMSPGRYGVGLSNTSARLFQQYGDEASFHIQNMDAGGVNVHIQIPFSIHE